MTLLKPLNINSQWSLPFLLMFQISLFKMVFMISVSVKPILDIILGIVSKRRLLNLLKVEVNSPIRLAVMVFMLFYSILATHLLLMLSNVVGSVKTKNLSCTLLLLLSSLPYLFFMLSGDSKDSSIRLRRIRKLLRTYKDKLKSLRLRKLRLKDKLSKIRWKVLNSPPIQCSPTSNPASNKLRLMNSKLLLRLFKPKKPKWSSIIVSTNKLIVMLTRILLSSEEKSKT